jgi:hypothetical protein
VTRFSKRGILILGCGDILKGKKCKWTTGDSEPETQMPLGFSLSFICVFPGVGSISFFFKSVITLCFPVPRRGYQQLPDRKNRNLHSFFPFLNS